MGLQARIGLPGRQFAGVEKVTLRPRPGDQHHASIPVPVGQRTKYHGSQRGKADPTRDDHQITPGSLGHSPAGAERPTYAQRRSRFGRTECRADRPDRADGVGEDAV